MPSIFIWKSSKPNTSKKTIRIYSGSNWMLEDNDYSSKSYKFIDQIVIPGFNDSVITFNTKSMPQDWIGTELLEVTQVAYELIKTDNYGTLEQLGNWMRFTSSSEIEFNKETLESELIKIKSWMDAKTFTKPPTNVHTKQYNPNKSYNKHQEQRQQHRPKHHHPHTIDTNFVQEQFKNFLIKFDINNINTNMLGGQSMIV
jgi:hypothetical protein